MPMAAGQAPGYDTGTKAPSDSLPEAATTSAERDATAQGDDERQASHDRASSDADDQLATLSARVEEAEREAAQALRPGRARPARPRRDRPADRPDRGGARDGG